MAYQVTVKQHFKNTVWADSRVLQRTVQGAKSLSHVILLLASYFVKQTQTDLFTPNRTL